MATIADYQNEFRIASQDIATTDLILRKALIAAVEATKSNPADFYVDLSRLDIEAVRATFCDTFETELTAPYQAGIAAMPGDRDIAKQLFMNGWFGFQRQNIDEIVDGYRGNLTQDGFLRYIMEKTGYTRQLETRMQNTRAVLDQVPTAKVLAHVGVSATSPNMVTIDDKLELMGIYNKYGSVPPKMIDGKPYM